MTNQFQKDQEFQEAYDEAQAEIQGVGLFQSVRPGQAYPGYTPFSRGFDYSALLDNLAEGNYEDV